MDFNDLVKGRRSVRGFSDEPVSPEDIETILEAARWAPSAGNRQPWHFYVARDQAIKEELVDVALGQQFVAEASLVICVCAEPERSAERYGDRGRTLYCLQDTAAAIQNILLMVHHLGLAACWIGAFDEQRCSEVLSLPDDRRPVALIPIGRGTQDPSPRSRRSMAEITDHI